MCIQSKKPESGYIAIITVVIISIVTLVIAVAVAFSGLNESLIGLDENHSEQLLHGLDGCAEEAYFRLKKNASYTGGTIPYTDFNCVVTVTGGGVVKTITSSGTFASLTRDVSVIVNLQNNTGITSEGVSITTWGE